MTGDDVVADPSPGVECVGFVCWPLTDTEVPEVLDEPSIGVAKQREVILQALQVGPKYAGRPTSWADF